MLTIKVLGPGCDNCQNLAVTAQKAVASFRIEAEVIKVTDRTEFQKYNLLITPGLVIEERLVSAGRIPSEGEIISWMADALETA